MALRFFQALPPYFGGKRGLTAQIFRHVPPPADAPVFVDAFMGGGSVALYAKARGYRVIANDIAERSAIVGRAVIANGTVRLHEDDVRVLLAPHPASDGYVEKAYASDHFLPRHARIIDGALAHARSASNPVRRDLLLLAVVHFILRWRPFGDFHQPGLIHKLVSGDCDDVNPNVYKVKLATLFKHPSPERMRLILRDLNRGIFSNGHENAMHQEDVFDFLEQAEGDILYLDPPYWGSNAYEKVYRVLDSILAGREVERSISRFNRSDAKTALLELLGRAARFPVWVLSFGGGRIDAEECREMVARFRSAEVIPVHHRYHYAEAGGQRADAKEILVIGRAP